MPTERKDKETGENKKGKRIGCLDTRKAVLASGGLFAALFLFMAGFLVYFVATNEQDMVNNSYNSRQQVLLSRNYRGTIYSRDGQVLAETVTDAAQNETRVYPFGKLFAHVVGYSTKGRTGVEAQANYYLINTNISLSSKAANDMAGVKNPGDNVYTTLDVRLQEIADSQLDIYRGAVVVTEVSTGRILAMVSHPGFDPNQLSQIWDSLLSDDDSSVLVNRAAQGLYPPGSTFKLVTALEYIRENGEEALDYQFSCPGYFQHGEQRIHCYHSISHGEVDFTLAMAKSCNSAFAEIGMGLDRSAFSKTLETLLFGRELPLTMSHAQSPTAVSEEMSDSEMMQVSIGENTDHPHPSEYDHLRHRQRRYSDETLCGGARGDRRGQTGKELCTPGVRTADERGRGRFAAGADDCSGGRGDGHKAFRAGIHGGGKDRFRRVRHKKRNQPRMVYRLCACGESGDLRHHNRGGCGERRRLRGSHCPQDF